MLSGQKWLLEKRICFAPLVECRVPAEWCEKRLKEAGRDAECGGVGGRFHERLGRSHQDPKKTGDA